MERGREATIVDSTVPAATLRRPHDSGQACLLAWLEEGRRRRGSCEAKGHDTGSKATTTARRAQQQQGRCLAVSEEQRCDTRVRRTAFEQLLSVPIAWEAAA